MTVLPVYEYIITFRHEVAIVWTSRISAVSVLLLSIRWNMLLTGILTAAPSTPQVRQLRHLSFFLLTHLITHLMVSEVSLKVP